MSITLAALTASPEVVERLRRSFDFHIVTDAREPGWFSVDGAESFERIGRDGTGGAFVSLPGSPRVLYISSEGESGIVAADLDAFMALIVACPYWRDILKYSANGNLDEMRRAAPVLESVTLDEEEGLDEARDFLKSELGLAEPEDPVGALYRAVSTSDVVVRAPDGNPCSPLFGRFTIDDHPMLRDIAD
jgi:hypothetical protein